MEISGRLLARNAAINFIGQALPLLVGWSPFTTMEISDEMNIDMAPDGTVYA